MVGSLVVSGLLITIILMYRRRLHPYPVEARVVAFALLIVLTIVVLLEIYSRRISDAIILSRLVSTYFLYVQQMTIFLTFAFAWLAIRYWHTFWRQIQIVAGFVLAVLLVSVLLHAREPEVWRWVVVYTFNGYQRPHGILTTPLAAGCVGLCGWAWGFYWALHSDWRRWTGLLLVGLSVAVVYLTLSRSAWVGLLFATLLGCWYARCYSKLWLPLIMTIATFTLCSVGMPIGWSRSLYAGQGDPSVQARLYNWNQLATTFFNYPFGYSGARPSVQNLAPTGPMSSFYLDLGATYGVIPLLLSVGIAIGLGLRSRHLLLSRRPEAGWGLGTISTVICLFFTSVGGIAGILVGGLWGLVAGVEVPNEKASVHSD